MTRSNHLSGTAIMRAAVLLFLAAGATAVSPVSADAQCIMCAYDYQEDTPDGPTLTCVDYLVGGSDCILGPDFCITEGFCEWIMLLDFSEDGTAHRRVKNDPLSRDGAVPFPLDETSERTCDGVLLGTRAAAATEVRRVFPTVLHDIPLMLEL